MDLVFNVPLNRVSFGQVSYNLLKVAKDRGHTVYLFPIGPIDLATQAPPQEFVNWLQEALHRAQTKFERDIPGIKLWHLATPDEFTGFKGHYEKFSDNTSLISFYELNHPTELELNVARNFNTIFTSNYTCEIFKKHGVTTRFAPLAFDKNSFQVVNKRFFPDDRIVFCLVGKFEQRKHHNKIIKTWTKRFGNSKRYYLQLAVYNPFFNPQVNSNLIGGAMEGKHYWNVNSVPWIPTNQLYNDFLNSNNIVIGMSGGEGWGLPEFHLVALGKHAVILNAHAYKDWATKENAVLIEPSGMISAVDGLFFKQGNPINQGEIFDWNEDAFITGCEAAIERYRLNPVNTVGLNLQNQFTYEKTFDALFNK